VETSRLTEIMRLLSGWKEVKASKNPAMNYVMMIIILVVKNAVMNESCDEDQ